MDFPWLEPGATTVAEPADEILTIDELGRYLKLSKSTLYKLAQEGKIPGQKIGRHWRFSRRAIDRWIEREGGEHGQAVAGEE